jgi:hypothetical protein
MPVWKKGLLVIHAILAALLSQQDLPDVCFLPRIGHCLDDKEVRFPKSVSRKE